VIAVTANDSADATIPALLQETRFRRLACLEVIFAKQQSHFIQQINAPTAAARTTIRFAFIANYPVVSRFFRTFVFGGMVGRSKICVGSVLRLIKAGIVPAQQLMPCVPWRVPVEALESKQIKIGVQDVIARRPLKVLQYHQNKILKLPGF
jgi:hypothetical protein